MHGDSKAQADEHPAGVRLHRLVDDVLQLGEFHDAVEAIADLALRETHHDAVDEGILPTAELQVKTGAELQNGRDPPLAAHSAGVGAVDPRQELEECTLARAVPPGDAQSLALGHAE